MDREQAKEYINGQEPIFLQKAQKGYICPKCGQGATKGNGITRAVGRKYLWHCVGENRERSILGLFAIYSGIPDDREHYLEILERAAQYYNITIDSGKTGAAPRSAARQDFTPIRPLPGGADQQEQPQDYSAFIAQSAQNIERTDYHRGLSLETLNRFKIGYVESWKHPKAPKMEASPRLIIPTSKHSYLARYAGQGDYINFRGQVENKSKVGSLQIFNSKALFSAVQPIYIVEGEIDALSIIDVGGEAIGLGTTTMTGRLLSLLEKQPPAQPLIIALDNDGAGEKAAAELINGTKNPDGTQRQKGLQALEIPFFRCNIAGHYKDANEALQADRAAFTAAVNEAIHRAEITDEERKEQLKAELEKEAVAYWLPNFIKNIEESKTAAYIPTGFLAVDGALDGGLYAGLYIVGAISSLGKTTFCLQIADQIAQAGNDVIIFSLEMARNELIAKSVSRLTLLQDIDTNNTTKNAKTTRGILTGSRYKYYSEKEQQLIQGAITRYAEYGKNIYITEGIGNVGIAEIRDKVEKHIEITGKAPVVLIDYLQILAPADIRATDKQNTDKAVLELKRLSRDYSIPVIGISSFNRDNYTAPVNLASFKESGAIEYSSDVLIGLQYEGMDYQEGEAEAARNKRLRGLMKQVIEDGKAGRPQKIQVKILKNRNGSKGEALLDFYPMFNYFTDKDSITDIKDGEGANNEWSSSESTYE